MGGEVGGLERGPFTPHPFLSVPLFAAGLHTSFCAKSP